MTASFMEQHGPALLKGGFAILPIKARDKVPSRWDGREYRPLFNWRERYSTRQPDNIVRMWGMWPECGVGIICGTVVAVDLDIDDEALQARAYAICNRILGVTPAVRVGRAPRRLLVYRTDTPMKKMSCGKAPAAVEILGEGQQFVAYGIHPAGHEYRWIGDSLRDLELSELPLVTRENVQAALNEIRGILPEPEAAVFDDAQTHNPSGVMAGTLEAISSALEWIPNPDLHWDEWNRIAMAIYGALGEGGWELFNVWSQESTKYDYGETLDKWSALRRSPPTSIGAGTIYHKAGENGWQCPPGITMNGQAARLNREAPVTLGGLNAPRHGATASLVEDAPPQPAEPVLGGLGAKKPPAADPLEGVVFSGQLPARAIPYLVAGVVPCRSVGCIAGESGVGKTFLEILLATCVASGRDFSGNRVKERSGVLIVAGEGFDTLNNRLIACQNMVCPEAGPLPIAHMKPLKRIEHSRDLLAEMPRLQAIADVFEEHYGVRLGVIFFDTIAASFFVEEENSSTDAQRCIELMNQVSEATGTAVIALHHYGKNGTLRGSTAFTAGFDFILTAEKEEKGAGRRQLHVRKDRNGKERSLGFFSIENVHLGDDEEGEAFGAGVMVLEAPVTINFGKTAPKDDDRPDPLVDALIRAIDRAETMGTAVSNRLELAKVMGCAERQVRSTIDNAKEEKLIEIKNKKYFLTAKGRNYRDKSGI